MMILCGLWLRGHMAFKKCTLGAPFVLIQELFPTVVVVNIPFSCDCREMFSEQIPTAAES